jgi:hypothetical protein
VGLVDFAEVAERASQQASRWVDVRYEADALSERPAKNRKF